MTIALVRRTWSNSAVQKAEKGPYPEEEVTTQLTDRVEYAVLEEHTQEHSLNAPKTTVWKKSPTRTNEKDKHS